MPSMTREQLVAAIAADRFGAISIDTTVFDSKQCNFRNAALRSLSQFKDSAIQVVVVDFIASEMLAHLEEKAVTTQRTLKSAVRQQNLRWHRTQPEGEADALRLTSSATEFARTELDSFSDHVGVQFLAASDTPDAMQEMFRRYFAEEPPFGTSDTRKYEFPDAAALLRLEFFAKQSKSLVLCIAQDKSWQDFAKTSEYLVTEYPLEEVLAVFSEAAAHQDLAHEIVRIWKSGEAPDFAQHVTDAIAERLELADFEIEADSGPQFEAHPYSADLVDIDLTSLTPPLVLAATDTTVTFSIRLKVTAEFSASFEFYAWDGIDRESISLGSEIAQTTDEITLTLTIIAERDVSDGIDYEEVEVSYTPFTVDFGYVEAFPGEDPTHEKY
ncbi:MAG: PIN domain-containing protein [Pseudotabrizicola sp.]|uniref:PIN domain-containing protein n=1 Tax=Pseudotabrizicola sp. TaxID=2939647 RepID=UPI0027236FCC|nr:PIN domain-containing protein [Pseudotabrizicola sp.]MDO9639384.1 PIN domain-containing protein [Pseudotabrizicola sp.]